MSSDIHAGSANGFKQTAVDVMKITEVSVLETMVMFHGVEYLNCRLLDYSLPDGTASQSRT
jgi:hypothetical protein